MLSSKTKYVVFIPFFFLLFSCNSNNKPDEIPIYSFVAAGHVYGNPIAFTSSIYPPCYKKLDSLSKSDEIDLLVLMGDVVPFPSPENWERVKEQLDSLTFDRWLISRGNHDVSPYLDASIQAEKYLAVRKEENLFLILNTSYDGWTVDSLQLEFLKAELAEVDAIENIFVFSHQLWWLNNPPSKFKIDAIQTNSDEYMKGETTFWTDVFPVFEELEQEIYFFAGDIGAIPSIPAYSENHFRNYHFYGSGMGSGIDDNILLGQIFQDGTVKIERIEL